MKALVERLRAEIAFLREQVKNSTERDSSERTVGVKGEKHSRAERSNEKEIELQNQLLDLQENYTALSNRHAKVISEITRASDTEDAPANAEYTDTAVERLKRSNSFAEAVETVVLEYEKTIQSLESSLTSTRSSLSQSESTLLEKESKLAYVETVNQQLQARLQKMMDRESSTETYLHDLETKLDGHTSGEEKNVSIIAELKKEVSRARENEVGCEDYISTLEERLAEAEQDMELMQREIDRLEHVIDRQRSLGKLDNLLVELDAMKEKSDKSNGNAEQLSEADSPEDVANGATESRSRTPSIKSDRFIEKVDEVPEPPSPVAEAKRQPEEEGLELDGQATEGIDYPLQSPAQSQFVADKLENVQQELFDLRVEHETTLNEYDQMSANYESALRDIAALQDQLDEVRHSKAQFSEVSRGTSPPQSPVQRPVSFLADARVSDLREEEGQPSSSRSLSSELSLVGDLPLSSEITEKDMAHIEELEAERAVSREKEAALMEELAFIKQEKEDALRVQEEEQERLHLQLRQSLDQLAEYKNRERSNGTVSVSPVGHVLRRKSSQTLAVIDRAQRSFTNLKRLAAEHLEDQPEILENFELNLESALRELQTRSERIQELESETTQLRKEMESKTSLIAGLTRERTSISTSPMDISVILSMERRIEESEGELIEMRKSLSLRESELASAKKALEALSSEQQSDAMTLLEELTAERALNADQARKITELQQAVEEIQTSQEMAFASLRESKDTLEHTLQELETELKYERSLRQAAEGERANYEEHMQSLESVIAENKATIGVQLARVTELERLHSNTQRQIDDERASSSASDEEIKRHQQVASDLEKTIAENREIIENQQLRLSTLEKSYKDAMEQLEALRRKEAVTVTALKDAEARVSTSEQEEVVTNIRGELEQSRNSISLHIDSLSKLQSSYNEANATIEKLEQEKAASVLEATRHAESAQELEKQVEEGRKALEASNVQLQELQELLAKNQKDFEALQAKEQKHAKLVEEVEQQLTYTFDEKEETAKKLLAATTEYERIQRELAESEAKTAQSQRVIEGLNDEITGLKVCPFCVAWVLVLTNHSRVSNKPMWSSRISAVTQPGGPTRHRLARCHYVTPPQPCPCPRRHL